VSPLLRFLFIAVGVLLVAWLVISVVW